MKVALTGEGTYPHQFGGVSVWCDQLVRGLPQHDFTVVPLVATGNEPVRWELPGNVTSVLPIPLWGRPPSVPWRARLARSRDDTSMLPELIDVLLSPPDQAQDRFTGLMHEMFSFAQTRNLRAVLASETAVRLLSDAWRQRWPDILPEIGTRWPAGLTGDGDDGQGKDDPGKADLKRVVPTLADAVTAMQLLEHALRPLSHPPVQADVVHVVTNGLGALPAFAAKWQYGLPIIVTEHGVYMREQYLHLRRPEFGWPVKDLYLRFLRRICTLGYHEAEVITPGNIYNRRWEAELGADESRVRTVYNGVDPAIFPVLSEEPEVPTISWAGRIDPFKDLFTLLRAFSLVVREMPQARLRIFGSAPHGGEAYLERCRAEAAELGISELATFEGRVPEIRDAYAAGHVVVLCSITEGFPYTLIEAMACGRPCVGTNVGGVSEALGDDAGIIVPPRNPAAVAEACLRLLRDDGLRRTMGAAARARAIEHFTVDRAISAFDEMYARLGAGRADPDAGRAQAPDADDVPTAPQPVPQLAASRPEAKPPSRPTHWIALPPEEESTLVWRRPDAASPPDTDEDATQVIRLPVASEDATQVIRLAVASEDATQVMRIPVASAAEPDPDRTMIMPRLAQGTPVAHGDEPTLVLHLSSRVRPPAEPAEPRNPEQVETGEAAANEAAASNEMAASDEMAAEGEPAAEGEMAAEGEPAAVPELTEAMR
jgi:polysaccharide biosynthesis protein PelF